MISLEVSTKTFLEWADWLQEPVFSPLRDSLTLLAQDYDTDRRASSYAQYGLMLRYAMQLRPKEEEVEETPTDPLQAILGDIPSSAVQHA